MVGWLVNDRLTAIPGTRTFWHHLLDGIPGLVDKTTGSFGALADYTERLAAVQRPDYIIRNAAYFRRLDVECPVVSFVQDILHGIMREQLIDACAASRLVVFNSEYTRAMYPELAVLPYEVIPIGTDTGIFRPQPPESDTGIRHVLWVGSGHPVKGFGLACDLAAKSQRPWIFVMKDEAPVLCDAEVYRGITQDQLSRLASMCAVGVCTSLEETQHLAGIEMGMCGVPLVTTNVGVYYKRPTGAWGGVVGDDWHGDIEHVAQFDRGAAARYWRDDGFGLQRCIESWAQIVERVAAHVHG